jgi:hypothetical protein
LTGGLIASSLNFYYTNSSLDMQQQPNVIVTNNAFNFTVPADTIFTLATPIAPGVTGVTPISGLTSGGQSVTIVGSGFSAATGVSFGGVAASFAINSDTTITATTPAHAAGTVDVTVTNTAATSAASAADQFQYVVVNGTAPPTVATAASATVANNQQSASLSVLGASQYAAGTLTYTWATTGTPPAPVVFSTNGNNSAHNVTATFSRAGNYSFQVTITDPAGNSVISAVAVTVSQVAQILTISPGSAFVVPNGTRQFTATASDQFGNPEAVAPVSWTVSGGGTIDSSGKYTAGSSTGGPFTVTASAAGLNATSAVTVTANVALGGTAYRWFGLGSATSNTNQTPSPLLNDNVLTTDVTLSGGGDDVANAYEAAGIIWAASQTVGEVTFTNGSFNNSSFDGVFDNNFGLQVSTDGTTWTGVSGWSLSPAYAYNAPAAAGVTYTFSGPALSVLGVRVVGQVHSLSGDDSYFDNATEVQAFRATATTAVASSLNATKFGQPITLTATVTSSGAGTPTGTVTFTENGNTLGTVTLNANGQATYSTIQLLIGTDTITAVYGGDGNFSGSTSAALTQTVTIGAPTPPLLRIGISPLPAAPGLAVAAPSSPGGPTGTAASGVETLAVSLQSPALVTRRVDNSNTAAFSGDEADLQPTTPATDTEITTPAATPAASAPAATSATSTPPAVVPPSEPALPVSATVVVKAPVAVTPVSTSAPRHDNMLASSGHPAFTPAPPAIISHSSRAGSGSTAPALTHSAPMHPSVPALPEPLPQAVPIIRAAAAKPTSPDLGIGRFDGLLFGGSPALAVLLPSRPKGWELMLLDEYFAGFGG